MESLQNGIDLKGKQPRNGKTLGGIDDLFQNGVRIGVAIFFQKPPLIALRDAMHRLYSRSTHARMTRGFAHERSNQLEVDR